MRIPGDSWGFLRIPGDSRGFLRILQSTDHGFSQDSEEFCYIPWKFLVIPWLSSKTVQGFWSVKPLAKEIVLTGVLAIHKTQHFKFSTTMM